MQRCAVCLSVVVLMSATPALAGDVSGDAALGSQPYDEFERPRACASCHATIFEQWQGAMMSQAYTHHWDEIEYFKLAVPHADKEPKVAGVKAGCNGCHAPLSFLAGDVPPPEPKKKSRANESVSCDLCHTIKGRAPGDPHNFNWIVSPGDTKYGPRDDAESPEHDTAKLPLMSEPEFCGTCHNEKSPYGIWVKSTHLEYAAGPYPAKNMRCHDCHMPKTKTRVATMGAPERMSHQHLFHGAHVPSKLAGAIEMRMHPDRRDVVPGETVKVSLYLFNAKAGHKIPTGSVEDRQVWVHVEAKDANGKVYHLPVDKKGFAGEETTIASNELAWFDLGEAMGLKEFKGLPRDSLPEGDRIFRMAYFNPKKQMTIMQWYTASLGVDYRIGPLETKIETYTFRVPDNVPIGPMTVEATLGYRLLVKSIGDFLKVPAEETRDQVISTASTSFELFDD